MKVVFVYAGYESLGIEYLSAVLKKHGHETSLVFDPSLFDDSFTHVNLLHRIFSIRKRLIASVIEEKPDLVAFSVLYNNFNWFRAFAADLKERIDVPIVAGGHHITATFENVLQTVPVDFAVVGEGEYTLLALADSLNSGKFDREIPGLVYRSDNNIRINPVDTLIEDLDDLPFPDKSLYEATSLRSDLVYTALSTRGCPFSCTFCNNSFTNRLYKKGAYCRSRSVDNFIEEMKFAKESYNPKVINIYDEIFAFRISWLREFAARYKKEIGIPYMACTHPSLVTEERARLLVESGCIKIDIGVQTINQDLRSRILHRKGSNEDIARALKTLKNFGIYVAVENIINLPDEEEAHLIEMLDFYREHKPDALKFFWLSYFPKSEIVNIALQKGIFTAKQAEEINMGVMQTYSSFATGGYLSPKTTKQFYLLFIIMQVLPDRWIKKIVDKRWYRFFPTSSFFTKVSFVALRFFNRAKGNKQDNPDVMIKRYTYHYRYYIKKILKMKLFNK